jgi:hypothetical protein
VGGQQRLGSGCQWVNDRSSHSKFVQGTGVLLREGMRRPFRPSSCTEEDHAPLPSRRTRTRTGFHLAKSDASQASARHPRPCATSCFPLRADVAACPGCSLDLSSCAGVCPCSARPCSCCASVPSTGCARRVAVHPYYDFAPTRAALLSNPQTTSVDHLGWLQFRHLFRYYPGHAGRAG